MRKILVTNDDGVQSRGIEILKEIMKPYGEITVVAPFEPQSGMSVALTIGKPLRLTQLKNGENLKVYACTGTPVDCVKMAMNQIFTSEKPDLLISGINHGSNAAVASLYSGTLGATIEGTLYGIPSIGFSLSSHDPNANFDAVIKYGKLIIDNYLKHPPQPNVYLNVNFPAIAASQVKGIKICRQGQGKWTKEFEQRKDPYGFHYYWMTGEFFNVEDPNDLTADHNAVANNYISIVPHKTDNTHYQEIDRLKELWSF